MAGLAVFGGVIAFGGLTGLALVRLWAVLGRRLPGKLLLPLAAFPAALFLLAAYRFSLARRLLPPFGWKTALIGGTAFVLGAALDTSYAMFDAAGLLIDTPPFRLLCALGSGLVLALIALVLWRAAADFGRLDCSCGRTMLVLALAVNVVAALYAGGSATVHYWDAATYWDLSAALAAQPLGPEQLRQVLESVITQEYNSLLAWPISLVMRLLGTGRHVYLLAIVNLYVLPALWGLCVLGRRTRGGGVLLFLLTPMLLYTALVGFADVAAAGVGIWAFVIYTSEERPPVARGILTGGLLVLSLLLRRYFFFFAASFGMAALLALAVKRSNWKAFAALFAASAGCALFFAQSFLVDRVLRGGYFDLYSAYDQGRRVDVMMLSRYFGVIVLAAALAGGIALLLRRPALRSGGVLALAQGLLCFFLFTRVQSHGQQHLLLYLPALCWMLAHILELLPAAAPAAVGAWTLAAAVTASSLLPRPQPAGPREIRFPAPLPSFTYAPPVRRDLAQLIALRTYVDGLSAQSPKTAVVVASSFTFNDSIYANILRSAGIPEPDLPRTEMYYMATVDKRDGFSWQILTADYLLVGDPVQTHLGEENQQIMALVAHAVLDGTGIGTAYRPLEASFSLDGGVTVRVYERIRDLTRGEYQAISDALAARYPEYAAQYQPPDWALEAG